MSISHAIRVCILYAVRGAVICVCALACILSVAFVAEGLRSVPHIQKFPVAFRLNDWPVPTYLYSTLLTLIGFSGFVAGSLVLNRITSGKYVQFTLRGMLILVVFVTCGFATLNMFHNWFGRELVRAFFDQATVSEDVSQP